MSSKQLGLLLLGLFMAGLIGYNKGAGNTEARWVENSQRLIPIVVEYAIDRHSQFDDSPLSVPMDLIIAECELLYVEGFAALNEGRELDKQSLQQSTHGQ